jgi:sialic acid synthase SpsE
MFKRSIDVVKILRAGEAFTRETIRVIRSGIAPKYYPMMLTSNATRGYKAGFFYRQRIWYELNLNDVIGFVP